MNKAALLYTCFAFILSLPFSTFLCVNFGFFGQTKHKIKSSNTTHQRHQNRPHIDRTLTAKRRQRNNARKIKVSTEETFFLLVVIRIVRVLSQKCFSCLSLMRTYLTFLSLSSVFANALHPVLLSAKCACRKIFTKIHLGTNLSSQFSNWIFTYASAYLFLVCLWRIRAFRLWFIAIYNLLKIFSIGPFTLCSTIIETNQLHERILLK